MQQRRSLLHALGLAVALLPSGSAAVVSLDAQGVERVMSSARLTLVKFVHRARFPSLDQMFAQLDEQGFAKAGVAFATVDCAVTPDACIARKIDPDQMAGPIIKFWNGTHFRRYAGPPEAMAVAEYLTKKLSGLTEAQASEHARAYAAEAQSAGSPSSSTATSSSSAAASSKPPLRGLSRSEVDEVLLWVFQSFAAVLLLAYFYYRYLIRPAAEGAADVLVVGCAPAGPHSNLSLVRLDPRSGALTPLARAPFEKAEGSDPDAPPALALCAARAATCAPISVHVAERAAARAAAPRHASATTTTVSTFLLDLRHIPSCLAHVASNVLTQPPPLCATLSGWAATDDGTTTAATGASSSERRDAIAFASPDGAVHVARLSAPTAMAPPVPSTWGRLYAAVRRRLGAANARLRAPTLATALAAPPGGAHAVPTGCAALWLGEAAAADGGGGEPMGDASHLLVASPASGELSLVALADAADAAGAAAAHPSGAPSSSSSPPTGGTIVGVTHAAPDACPCALAVQPTNPSLVYVLCDGDRSVLVVEVKGEGAPPEIVQRLPLPASPRSGKQSQGGARIDVGALCATADGRHVYALLGGDTRVCVLTTSGGGAKLAVAGGGADVALPKGDGASKTGGGSGAPPTIVLAGGGAQSSLVVLSPAASALFSYRRDPQTGALSAASSFEMEAPTSMLSFHLTG